MQIQRWVTSYIKNIPRLPQADSNAHNAILGEYQIFRNTFEARSATRPKKAKTEEEEEEEDEE